MKKKGFEMQFHWIFILIAGAIILAFFFSVVQKQTKLSKEKLSLTLATNLDAIFAGAVESKGTSQILEMPRTGIAFHCSEGCDCNFNIGQKSTSFRDKFIFAPSILSNGEMIAWALDWKMPFRVANFFFITGTEVKYYFIYDQNEISSKKLKEDIEEILAKEINFEFKALDELNSVKKTSNGKTRFVFLKTDASQALDLIKDKFSEADVSVLHVKDESILRFYNLQEGSFIAMDSFYSGIESLLGGVFSEDKTLYECNIRNAFRKMSRIAEVYSLRTDELSAMTDCVYLTDNLNLLKDLSEEVSRSDISMAAGLLNQIDSEKALLAEQNKNKILESCPEIY